MRRGRGSLSCTTFGMSFSTISFLGKMPPHRRHQRQEPSKSSSEWSSMVSLVPQSCHALAKSRMTESFFSSTASVERKYLGFEVFRKSLPRVDATTMPMLFTQNYMRSWINHLSGKERQLHKAALQVVRSPASSPNASLLTGGTHRRRRSMYMRRRTQIWASLSFSS